MKELSGSVWSGIGEQEKTQLFLTSPQKPCCKGWVFTGASFHIRFKLGRRFGVESTRKAETYSIKYFRMRFASAHPPKRC